MSLKGEGEVDEEVMMTMTQSLGGGSRGVGCGGGKMMKLIPFS